MRKNEDEPCAESPFRDSCKGETVICMSLGQEVCDEKQGIQD